MMMCKHLRFLLVYADAPRIASRSASLAAGGPTGATGHAGNLGTNNNVAIKMARKGPEVKLFPARSCSA